MKYNYNQDIEILEKFYQQAIELIENQALSEIQEEIKVSLDIFIQKIETDKSLIQVIITTLLKKIIKPEQDIRLHMAKFPNGYSARVLDTKVTTPFFKINFPRYANKEVYEQARGIDDDTIIQKAFDENWILITSDKDFGEKVYRDKYPHRGVILLRLENERSANKIYIIQQVLEQHKEQLSR
jgi:DNA (cytosine-5)-methyltransferase 1